MWSNFILDKVNNCFWKKQKKIIVFAFVLTHFIFLSSLQATQNYSSKVETYLKGLKCLSTQFLQQNPDGSEKYGKIYLLNKNINISYEDKLYPTILVKDKNIHIIDRKNKKQNSYSIKETPIYDILSGNISLKREKYTINEFNKNYIKVTIERIAPMGITEITLIFSKYDNGNLKYFEGWIIKEPNGNEIAVAFLENTLFINDPKKIPPNVFDYDVK